MPYAIAMRMKAPVASSSRRLRAGLAAGVAAVMTSESGERSMGGVRGGGGLGRGGVAAAQRIGEAGVQLIGADAQIGIQPRLGQYAGLRDEHRDVVAHAGLVALDREVVGGI